MGNKLLERLGISIFKTTLPTMIVRGKVVLKQVMLSMVRRWLRLTMKRILRKKASLKLNRHLKKTITDVFQAQVFKMQWKG